MYLAKSAGRRHWHRAVALVPAGRRADGVVSGLK